MSAYQFPELADISQTGAKVRGGAFPPKGSILILKVGPLEVLCRVVRIAGEECGLRFEESVSPKMIKEIHLGGTVQIAAPPTP